MSGSRRCVFLTGAPRQYALSWDEPGLLQDFEDSVQRFLGTKDPTIRRSMQPSPTGAPAKWRSVCCDESESMHATTRRRVAQGKAAESLSKLAATRHIEDHEFLEHSIAVLEDLDVSQIICTAVEDENDVNADLQTTGISFATTSFTDVSTEITDDSFATASPTLSRGVPATLKLPGGITDLKSLPKADYVNRIRPQTMSVNLLVGIISISSPRTVRLRRRNTDIDIIELTVGDDTRAGFCITFWLTPETSQIRKHLKQLRSGQVALLQNVALTSWKGNVNGWSLNKRFARNSTSVSVIGSEEGVSFSSPVVSKLQRVRDWVDDFVGVDKRRASFAVGGNAVKKRKLDELPPDTQD